MKLAGRLERIAAAKARSRVKPGVGEVHGIDLGADPSRLLPSELVSLRHPRLRLALMSRIVQRRALTYGMKGREPLARGPVVVLLDESSSMRGNGKDVWSKAVCLALLSTATRQKRAWHLIAFNAHIRREVYVPVGQATPGPSSGEPVPSPEDVMLTARLKEAGALLGIPLLDHIVIGRGSYLSMLDRGLI